jgi:ubiquinone/menaquinone biosynthesis C-methylase UbiE
MRDVQLHPKSRRELAAAYDSWYSQWDPQSPTELDDSLFSYHLAALDLAGEAVSGRTILDAGCGDGRLTCELARRGAGEVVGIDISETALLFANRRASGLNAGISFHPGDIEALPVPDERFSVVFCCETLEHVLSPRAALNELRRVLAPGGTLILTTPNYLSLLGLHRLSTWIRRRPYSEGGQPVNNLTMWPRTLTWLSRAGFRVERLRSDQFVLAWPFAQMSAIKSSRR